MNAEVFVDTNVLLYSISDQPEEQAKAGRARALLLTESWGWSVQVAGEFFATATSTKREFRLPIEPDGVPLLSAHSRQSVGRYFSA